MSKRHKLDDATFETLQSLDPEDEQTLGGIFRQYFWKLFGAEQKPEEVISWLEYLAKASDGALLAKILSYLEPRELALMCRISKFINAVCVRYKMTQRIIASHLFIANHNHLETPVEFLRTPIKMIACGTNHAIAITTDGKSLAWGLSKNGIFGDGNIERHYINPQNEMYRMEFSDNDKITFVACSDTHTVFVTQSGNVYACGNGTGGLLGDGNVENHIVGAPTRMLLEEFVISATCSKIHTVLITYDGEAFACGYADGGVLGINDATERYIGVPTKVQIEEFVVSASCSDSHTVFVTKNGHAYVCGSSLFGILGIDVDIEYITIPAKVEFDDPDVFVVSSAASSWYTLFVAQDGRVFASGYSNYGALGFGTDKIKTKTPFPMSLPPNVSIKSATCSSSFGGGAVTLLIAKDGRVFLCGIDWYKLTEIKRGIFSRFFNRGDDNTRYEIFTPEPVKMTVPVEFAAIQGTTNMYFIAVSATHEYGFLTIACDVCKTNELQYVDREELIGVCGPECWERRQIN